MLVAAALLMAAPASAQEAWQLARSEVRTATAPDGHVYRVFVAWPEGEPPAAGWPVLWLLDGEDNFAVAALTARRLPRARERSGVGPGLIVAIDSGPLARRVEDYTPAAPDWTIPQGAPAHGLPTGGADRFLDFIDQRLHPQIARRWPIDASRQTLMGHSFGGLLALHALFTGRDYTRFVAVSPSLWFGGGSLANEEAAMVAPTHATALLVASGDEGGPSGASGASAEALTARLATRGVATRYLALPGQDHGATMLAAMTQGVSLAFADGRAQ